MGLQSREKQAVAEVDGKGVPVYLPQENRCRTAFLRQAQSCGVQQQDAQKVRRNFNPECAG